MKKQARVLKHGLMGTLLAVFAFASVVMVDEAKSADKVERIPFVLETLKADKMPPVFFSHDLHIAALDDNCESCHTESDVYFLDSENIPADKVMAYVHDSCVSCHAKVAADKPTGPALASCRSCHSQAIAAEQAAAK